MNDEVAAFILPRAMPLEGLAALCEALAHAGVLDGGFSLEVQQLSELGTLSAAARALVDALAGYEHDAAQVAAALRAFTPHDGEPTELFVYFRLVAPTRLSDELYGAYQALLGEPPGEPGEHWVVHPYECWAVLDLCDVGGARRSAPLQTMSAAPSSALPAGVQRLGRRGAPARAEHAGAIELRTLAANGSYLALVLDALAQTRDGAFVHVY